MKKDDILRIGEMLFDEYRILDSPREGGWGYVYKAQHLELPRLVAIKQLKPELIENKSALQQFSTEANTVVQISHPNVVTIYDFRREQKTGLYFIITEFAEKGTLADRLAEAPEGLPVEQILHIGMGICSGLQAVHRRGIVHRDIKPSNVLLFDVEEDRDVPKLSDFGVACASAATEVLDRQGSGVTGTLAYMSPEQLEKDIKDDCRSDLYSLGILLYELLVGRVPFAGEVEEIIAQHIMIPPTPPSELRSDIPEALEQIVLRALRKDRKDRYQSAADMLEAFRAIRDVTIQEKRKLKCSLLIEQGTAALQEERWEEAVDLFRQADVLEPGNERVRAGLREANEQQRLKRLYELGIHHLGEKNWERAREYLADVMSVDPEYAHGQARKQLELASQELERKRNQHDLVVRYRTGVGHFRNGQWAKAVTHLQWVASHDPEFEDVKERLEKAQRYLRAEQLYEQVPEYQKQEEWEQVVSLLEEIDGLRHPHIDVTQELAVAKGRRAQIREAQLLDAWYDAGITHLATGDLEQARANLKRVYDRQCDYKDVANRLMAIEHDLDLKQCFERASAYEAAQEWEKAVEVYEHILDIEPSNEEARRRLKKAQKRARRGNRQWLEKIAATIRNLYSGFSLQEKEILIVLLASAFCAVIVEELLKSGLESAGVSQRILLGVFFFLIFASTAYLTQKHIVRRR